MPEAVIALLETDVESQPALVVNAGKAGVCVDYFPEKCSCRWRQLTISFFHAGCFLRQMPVEIVYDSPVNNAGNGHADGMRRCGLKFSEPTYTQQALWDFFLEQNATAVDWRSRRNYEKACNRG
ncbi:MAG: hypothetical protein KKC76_06275 [Proteobacteria bacterium]|nr:hypothetical protein [Pseudomonadota bacterium]MBU4297627.1 hypothetical protein [Pseudomonadota bacterium]MCG2750010.1 hypothetical protein [Desulfobulbaceae bacterium]